MKHKELRKWWAKKQEEDAKQDWLWQHREMIIRTDEPDEVI